MNKTILIPLVFLILISAAHAGNNTTLEITNDAWYGHENFYVPSLVRENQSFEVKLEIKNTGAYNASNVSINLTGINVTWITSAVNNSKNRLEPNSTLQPIFTLQMPQVGGWNITAWINADNSNSTNSTKSMTIVNKSSLLVSAGKSVNALSHSASFDNLTRAGNVIDLNVTVTNTGNRTIDRIVLEVSGVDASWVVSKPDILNLAAGDSATSNIRIKMKTRGNYTVSVKGTAWYNLSVEQGSTSYEAFSQIANLTASWTGGFINAYWVQAVDGLAGAGWATGWSYYRNAGFSACGVGCIGGSGCQAGDFLSDGDSVEQRFVNWADVSQVPFSTMDVEVKPQLSPAPDTPSYGGGGGGSYTPRKSEPKIVDVAKEFAAGSSASVQLGTGSSAVFKVNHEEHSLKVDSIDKLNSRVKITISSEPVEITLGIGENKDVDLDEDGQGDLKVRLNAIKGEDADLTIEKVIVEELVEANEIIEKTAEVVEESENKTGTIGEEEPAPTGFITMQSGGAAMAVVGILIVAGLLILYRRRL